MTPGARYSVVFLFLLTLAAAGINLAWTARSVAIDDHKWCATMALLTSKPVPRPADPKANPSRMQTYVLYSDFTELRHRLGCG